MDALLGLFLLAVADASVIFFLPLAIDLGVVALAAGSERLFWLPPLVATGGSLAGATATYWIGSRIGEEGLGRVVPARRLARVKRRLGRKGALALALPALVPPPFPFTAFVVASGALGVRPLLFLATRTA